MSRFHHKRLRVYEEAMKLVVAVDPLAAKLERRRHYLADQIRRAALSIVLNIAEGAPDFSPAEKAKYFNYARRSASEVEAAFQVAVRLNLLSADSILEIVDQADKLAGMLTRMIVYHNARVPRRKATGAAHRAPKTRPKTP